MRRTTKARIGQFGAIGVAAGAALALAAPAAVAAGPGTAPGKVPPALVGNPKLVAGSAEGFSVWHDSKGYGLEVTHPGKDKVVFAGTVTANAPVHYVPVKLEAGDSVVVAKNGRSFSFSFSDFGKIDGLRFVAGDASKVRFALQIDGVKATPSQVFLGAGRTHPATVPFLVKRAADPTIGS